MDAFRCGQVAAWMAHRIALPPGPLLCVIDGATRGRRWVGDRRAGGVAPGRRCPCCPGEERSVSFGVRAHRLPWPGRRSSAPTRARSPPDVAWRARAPGRTAARLSRPRTRQSRRRAPQVRSERFPRASARPGPLTSVLPAQPSPATRLCDEVPNAERDSAVESIRSPSDRPERAARRPRGAPRPPRSGHGEGTPARGASSPAHLLRRRSRAGPAERPTPRLQPDSPRPTRPGAGRRGSVLRRPGASDRLGAHRQA